MPKLYVEESRGYRSDARTREVQSWIKYHAVRAAPSQFAANCVTIMQWKLRFKNSRQANVPLVIIGHHDPRIGGEVRTEAPVLAAEDAHFA